MIPKKKVSFTKIWQLFESIDTTCGAFLLRDSKRLTTIKDFIFKQTMPRLISMFTFIAITTMIVTNFDLISIIFCFSLYSSYLGLYGSMFFYISNKNVLKDLLKWCESIYDVKKKYHKFIHSIAETKLEKIERQTTIFLRLIRIILYVDAIGFTIGFAIIGLFLPENIYPKYSTPVPFYLPFKNQKTWLAFGCNTLYATIVTLDTATITIFLFGFSIGIFIHILGFMDIIQEAAEKMKEDILKKTRNSEITTKSTSLANISTNIVTSLSFDEWIKVLNDMICDVNAVIISAEKFYAFQYFLNELAGLGALFICGLLFTVVREQYFFAIGVTIVCWLLFIICYINEKIIEKFENINETLYDIPWYNLTPKQIKSLMLLMHCDKIQKGLTAARIHHLTFERFGIIVKAGYTNMLVLKDLVLK